MALRKQLKIKYFGLLGFLGFLGFQDPWYFLFFLFFLFFLAGIVSSRPDLPDSVKKLIEKKEEYKVKILEELNKSGRIANDQAQKLLGVSDASAERYLQELEQEGKIKQVGKDERDTYYIKI